MGNADKTPEIFPRFLRPRIDRIIYERGLSGLVQGPGGARGSAGNEDANHMARYTLLRDRARRFNRIEGVGSSAPDPGEPPFLFKRQLLLAWTVDRGWFHLKNITSPTTCRDGQDICRCPTLLLRNQYCICLSYNSVPRGTSESADEDSVRGLQLSLPPASCSDLSNIALI